MENARETQVLRKNLWKTNGKHMCCVGFVRERNGNTGVAFEVIGNASETLVLLGNIYKRKENIGFA